MEVLSIYMINNLKFYYNLPASNPSMIFLQARTAKATAVLVGLQAVPVGMIPQDPR